ncbi:MAG: hypothetical protein IPH64_14600 [Comamonadaceae bacterium]|nr:hypothetical protein [Comamonadaceae bacterium]
MAAPVQDRHWVEGVAIDHVAAVPGRVAPDVPWPTGGHRQVPRRPHGERYPVERVHIRLRSSARLASGACGSSPGSDAEHAVRQAGREGPVPNLDMWLARRKLAAAYQAERAFYNIYDLPEAQAVAAFDAFGDHPR